MDDREPGFLRRATVKAVTRSRYEQACANFASRLDPPVPLRCLSPRELDEALSRHLEFLYLAGEAAGAARHALYGTCYVLDLVPRDPPVEVVWLAKEYFLKTFPSPSNLQLAAFTWLAFDGYMRPSEGLAMRAKHFFKSTVRGRTAWSTVIGAQTEHRPAKNLQFDDGFVVGAHDRSFLKGIVAQLVRALPPDERVFPEWDLPGLELAFRGFSASEGIKLTPHALRHAGPSHDFYYHEVPVTELQWRGRWLATESCRRYSKPAKMLRCLATLTKDQLRRAKRAADEVPVALLKGLTELRSGGRGGFGRRIRLAPKHASRSSRRAVVRE